MSGATNPADDQAQRRPSPSNVHDPALVVAYFFSGIDNHASAAEGCLGALFDRLAGENHLDERFRPAFFRTDLRYLRFTRYQWNPESQATLAQFYVVPSQVWCIQLALPVRRGRVPLEEALVVWQEEERRLRNWVRDSTKTNESVPDQAGGANAVLELEQVYWGSSRLYWALTGEIARSPEQFLNLAKAVQSVVGLSESLQEDDQDDFAETSPVRPRVYVPQHHTGDYGTLWRLNEPVTDDELYQAAWLLLSPRAQNDFVAEDYIFNGRYAVGEVYLCKAHHQATMYTRVAQNLNDEMESVQSEVRESLQPDSPPGFAPDQIGQAQTDLQRYEGRIHRVSVAYSRLLFVLSAIDRLHLVVKTNLDNYRQMAAEFGLWEHPVGQSEMIRLQGILNQIEHDQRGRRASLQGFETAIQTVRATLALIGERISTALLEVEQEEAKRSERWNILVAILGLVLGVSQVVVLTPLELGLMLILLIGVGLALALVLVWQRLRRVWQRLRHPDNHRE